MSDIIKTKPVFHKRIFWDVDFEIIDYDAKAAFVISGYLSGVMYQTSAIAGATMAMIK